MNTTTLTGAVALALLAAARLAAQPQEPTPGRSLTLGETYALAEARSEALGMQKEYIAQLDAAEKEFASAFRPDFSFAASLSKQQGADASKGGRLSGSYAVFSGMRDYLSVRAAAERTGAARLDLERARQTLYYAAAQAYFSLQGAQRELAIRAEQLGVTQKRISELESRAEIGRSRRSEVVAARTQLAQDKASLLDSRAAERLAQRAMMFLTGLQEDTVPADLPLREGASVEEYLRAALLRPDLASARRTVDYYKLLSGVQDRSMWPAVGVTAGYYALRDPMPRPASRWDAGLTLTVPLYNGGYSAAARQASAAAERSARLSAGLAERQALSDVRSAFDEYTLTLQQAGALEEASALAAENAGLQQEDYKLGLVTNLDVLSALNTALQTRLSLSQARAAAALALVRLDTAAGLEAKQ